MSNTELELLSRLIQRANERNDGHFTIMKFTRLQLGDRRVDLREAVEGVVAQPSEQPALDHEDRLFDLGLVPWPSWPGRQMAVP